MAISHRRLFVVAACLLMVYACLPSARLAIAAEPQPARKPRQKVVTTKGSMLVKAVNSAGKPMAGAKIHVSIWTDDPFKANQDYQCNADGQVKINLPNTLTILRVWARSEGHVPLFAEWWPEHQDDGAVIPEEFMFRLAKGSVIGGVVRNEEDEPVPGARVEVKHVEARNGLTEERPVLASALAIGDAASITDAEGRWSLDNVPSGESTRVALKISHSDYIDDRDWGEMQQAQNVTMDALRAGDAKIVMQRGITVRGTVTDADGKPVAGAVVVWGDQPYRQEGSQETQTDDEGRFRSAVLPKGPTSFTAVAPGWAPAITKVDVSPETPFVDFRLQPGKKLRLRIVNRGGKPVPGAYVTIIKWRGGASLYNEKHSRTMDTKIPWKADDNGVFEWTWAPDDVVTYRVFQREYKYADFELTATDAEQKIVMPNATTLSGAVTDAVTGKAIENFLVIPVIEFSKDHIVTAIPARIHHQGRYTVSLDRDDIRYRVRIEAQGYLSAMSDESFDLSAPQFECDFKLTPAPPADGSLVDANGAPLASVLLRLATATQPLETVRRHETGRILGTEEIPPVGKSSRVDGSFSFPAQFERYFVIAWNGKGYAECSRAANQPVGQLTLQPYARVEGVLYDDGEPVPDVDVTLRPIRPQFGDLPRINDRDIARTDKEGRFVIGYAPPVKCALSAELTVGKDEPLISSQSIQLDLQPGQQVEAHLGAGPVVRGRVVLKGEAARDIALNYSRTFLLRKTEGIKPPPEIADEKFDWRNGWNTAWTATPAGRAYLSTLHHHFIKLNRDGTFRASGVSAGDYELAFQIYERAEDCLAHPLGAKVVRFNIDETEAAKGGIDLGEIEIEAALGPAPGEGVPEVEFELLNGGRQKLSDLRRKFVLVDFWATCCTSCLKSRLDLRELYETHRDDERLAIASIDVEAESDAAREFVAQRQLPWLQGYIADLPESRALGRLGVSSVPCYLLIAPDGTLIVRSFELDDIREQLDACLSAEN